MGKKLNMESAEKYNLILALREVAKEKGMDEEILFNAIIDAYKAGYKKKYGENGNVEVTIDRQTGDVTMEAIFTVVAENPGHGEISLADAQASDPGFVVGDVIKREVDPAEFGRLSAMAGKQVVMQRIREAEQSFANDYFNAQHHKIVVGLVQRIENGTVYVNLGRVDGVIPVKEQIPGEKFEVHSRVKALVHELNTRKTRNGAQMVLSRTHPLFLKLLFQNEVPEVYNGTVEVKSVAREPGSRSKISVFCKEKDIDPVGSCVGQRGMRIQNLVNELNGEKIDVVAYSDNPAEYVANALAPSKVVSATSKDENKSCRVVVPDYQLSLAIGKNGQNARLAAKLTGWKIDIFSESQAAEQEAKKQAEEEAAQKDEAAGDAVPKVETAAQEPSAATSDTEQNA